MIELQIFEELKEAYGATTPSNNRFEKKLLSIDWEDTFEADDEKYFVYGDMTFTVQSTNPFNEKWKPSALFTDGSYIEL